SDSFAFDRALLDEDVEGSLAWAEALARAGAIGASEARAIRAGLGRVRPRGRAGHLGAAEAGATRRGLRRIRLRGVPPAGSGGHEDVHSYVESALAAGIGPLAGKLHTGRSRNDQVATDLRLYQVKAL